MCPESGLVTYSSESKVQNIHSSTTRPNLKKNHLWWELRSYELKSSRRENKENGKAFLLYSESETFKLRLSRNAQLFIYFLTFVLPSYVYFIFKS